ncbi:phosphotransferase [Glaciecola sp. XM2]|uniref:phosphotransferase n=1 Tax=Glaciecola sp. XM2 TaxID=1914931 RepID=UPI001BDE304D|nr:phosphotransferase [Glaciecola sp. XM2]MBT1449653.1 phosphotransferase [Glaciecola sp. XM2]
MADELLRAIQNIYDEPSAHKVACVQSLWSGYGEIARYALPMKGTTCIAKHINLKAVDEHPRGWNTQASHQRKVSSYYNEQTFYQSYAQATTADCRVPSLVSTQASADSIWIIMEDLDASGFDLRNSKANVATTSQCIVWLAHFHAAFINKDISTLWPIGTYWHFATRQDEWQQMPESELKQSAPLLDARLNNAAFQTLLHGDAKLANFCFSQNNDHVAAVDFQYTGKGCGIKDVVYLLGSCFSDNELFAHSDDMIHAYFTALHHAIGSKLSDSQKHLLEREWRDLEKFAWADFERFLVGWSPGHHKLSVYSEEQTSKALLSL